jgi:CubicO group peptidase (beta-lactamase class C family)
MDYKTHFLGSQSHKVSRDNSNRRIALKRNLLILITTFVIASLTDAQLNEKQFKAIDSIAVSWNIADSPGGVAGIMKNGELLYLKSFGSASLDYDIANTENTMFNIVSISKQFTAMGIVKLQIDGKLSLDDDIRKYIPELPDFGNKITIRHMLHHTSGLRDIHSILTLAGWRADDPRSDDDLFRIMKNQKELNFIPFVPVNIT